MIRGFDDQAFQKRIDLLAGLNRDGRPILRLSYAPQVMTWALGEVVPRYWTKRTRNPAGGWDYEQPDRWVLEKRIEREAYWDAHNASRFQIVDGVETDLGPPPEEFYVFEHLIAVHEPHHAESGLPLCCERAWEGEEKVTLNARGELVTEKVGSRRRCWGVAYREPNDSDLDLIGEAVSRMRAGKYYDPYAPLTPEQLATLELSANFDAERMADEANRRIAEMSRDFNNLHGWRLTNTDAGKRSKFHFLGENLVKRPSGILVPNNS